MDLDHQLVGRRALVTGAGQGVGEGIARRLAAAGAEVVVNDLVADRAEAVVSDIVAAGGRASAAPFDVTDPTAVRQTLREVGPVGILVNNAGNAGADGFGVPTRFVDSEPDDWQRFVDVNLYGVLHCTHAVLPSMIDAGWGRIVTPSCQTQLAPPHRAWPCTAPPRPPLPPSAGASPLRSPATGSP